MKSLVEQLRQAIAQAQESEFFRDYLARIVRVTGDEEEVREIILGFGHAYIQILPNEINFVAGDDRVSVYDLARIQNLMADYRDRFLLPHTDAHEFNDGNWSAKNSGATYLASEQVEIPNTPANTDVTISARQIKDVVDVKYIFPADISDMIRLNKAEIQRDRIIINASLEMNNSFVIFIGKKV